MSSLKLLHSGGNGVIISAPSSNPAANRTITLNDNYAGDGSFVTANSSGNVGIGTASPAEELVVRADAPSIQLESSNASGRNYGLQSMNDGNFSFYDGTAGLERMRIDSSGNMKIGETNSSTVRLSLTQGSNGGIMISQGSGTTPTDGQTIGDIGFSSYSDSQTNSSSEAMIRAVAAGNHSGSSAPTNLLFFTKPSSVGPGSSPTERMRIQANGRIRMPEVYSTTGSSMRDVQIESNGTLAGLSSITASKTNITDITDVSWLYNLKPKTFNFRKKTTDILTGENTYLDEAETEKAYGLLAEDVETVNKDFCFYNKDSEGNDVLAGVYYKIMVVPLIKAVQDLKAENTALAARITALEGA